MTRFTRRALLVAAASTTLACRRGPSAPAPARCALCGMKIDPASAWRTELTTPAGPVAYDTPRCALSAWRRGKAASAIRVVEFYDRALLDGADVVFAIGSDVSGPMGPDLVPVRKDRADKFVRDHAAERAIPLDAVTIDVIDGLR